MVRGDVALQETSELVNDELVDLVAVAMAREERYEGCEETVGHGFAVYLIYNVRAREARFLFECLAESGGELLFQYVANKQSTQYGTTALIAKNPS